MLRRNRSTKLPLVVIVGPTASGKTALAIKLAKRFSGEIINADSRSIYKGLPILTAAPTTAEMRTIPHHLFGVQPLNRPMTLTRYQRLATKKILEIRRRAKLPFLVGGSALYINSVVYNYQIPAVKPDLKLRKSLEAKNLASLVEQLMKLEPNAIKQVDTKNKRRVIRAIEVINALGKLPSNQNAYLLPEDILIIGMKKSPAILEKNIKLRIKAMFRQGVVEEVALQQKLLKRSHPVATSCGAAPILELTNGNTDAKAAQEKFAANDRKLVKKQLTWFKRDPNIHWVRSEAEAAGLIRNKLEVIES